MPPAALHRDGAQARLSIHRAGGGAATARSAARRDRATGGDVSCCSAAPGRSAAAWPACSAGCSTDSPARRSRSQPGMGAVSVLLVLLCLTHRWSALIGRRRGRASGSPRRIAAAPPMVVEHVGRRARRTDRRRARQAARPRRVHPAVRPFAGRHHRRGRRRCCSAARSGSAPGWPSARAAARLRRSAALGGGDRRASAASLIALARRAADGRKPRSARPHTFPDSRLRLDQIGGLFGESGFGPVSQTRHRRPRRRAVQRLRGRPR